MNSEKKSAIKSSVDETTHKQDYCERAAETQTMVGGSNFSIPSVMVTPTNDDDTINNNIIPDSTAFLADAVNNNSQMFDGFASSDDGENVQTNALCLADERVYLDDMPIAILGPKSREKLSRNLNSIKAILSENGVERDWRGVLSSLRLANMPPIDAYVRDPMEEILRQWQKECDGSATIGELQDILKKIDRWDVIDDTSDLFGECSTLSIVFMCILEYISSKSCGEAARAESCERQKYENVYLLTILTIQMSALVIRIRMMEIISAFCDGKVSAAKKDTVSLKRHTICLVQTGHRKTERRTSTEKKASYRFSFGKVL